MTDRGDAERARPGGQAVEERKDDIEHREAHQEDDQVTPPAKQRDKRESEQSEYRQSPLRSHRIQASRERVEPRRPRRCHEPNEHRVDTVEWTGCEVKPER